jgi:hypothetical protein
MGVVEEGTGAVVVFEAEGEGEGVGVVVLVDGSQTSGVLLSLYKDNRHACPHISDLSPKQGVLHCASGITAPPLPWNSLPQ